MKKKLALASLALASLFTQANAAIVYDGDVTSNVIMGSGVTNGGFTLFRDAGIELGLRAKIRHNASGLPENTFNSNGDGTYSFNAAPGGGQPANVAEWSFEWSINSNFDGSGANLADFTYELLIDQDPTLAQSFVVFDPIDGSANPSGSGFWDHSMGDNGTAQSAGVEATNIAEFDALINANNIAQNSWKPHWFISPFDPSVNGTYTFSLAVSGANGFIGSTSMDVIVGTGAAQVSEPAMLGLLGLGFLGLAYRKKKQA